MSFINAVRADPNASKYLSFYSIHGYSGNGVTPGGGESNWAQYASLIAADGKESWMTETSGENPAWVHYNSNGQPDGALSVALNMHQTLAYGNVNAYVYWQMDDGSTATTANTLEAGLDPTSLKYNSAKHYMKFIRPGAVRLGASPDTVTGVSVDSWLEPDNSMTLELINASNYDTQTSVAIPNTNYSSFTEYLTNATQPWAVIPGITVSGGVLTLTVPANSVLTLQSDGLSIQLPEPAMGISLIPIVAGLLRRRRSA